MKIKINSTFIGLICAIVVALFTFNTASAALYTFSGNVVDLTGWDAWESLGLPAVSVGDSFMATMAYSFEEEPEVQSSLV